MKFFTQLSALTVSTLLFSASTAATPITAPAADLEVRQPIPVPEPFFPRHHHHHGGHHNDTDSNSTNSASSLVNGGTLTFTGVAFLGTAMLVLA